MTHAFVDIHDLFVEHFDAGARHYRFKDEMLPATHRPETILVRGGDDVTIDVVETAHGPVIAGDPTTGTALALQSVQFAVPDRRSIACCAMLRAKSVEQLYEATRGLGLIDHNLVAGDTSGKIGHRVRAWCRSGRAPMAGCRCRAGPASTNGTAWCRSRTCRTRSRRIKE